MTISNDKLTTLADAAFKRAARKVIVRAIDTGTRVIVWINGEVRALDPLRLLRATGKQRNTRAR
jgi:hypothetical protein